MMMMGWWKEVTPLPHCTGGLASRPKSPQSQPSLWWCGADAPAGPSHSSSWFRSRPPAHPTPRPPSG